MTTYITKKGRLIEMLHLISYLNAVFLIETNTACFNLAGGSIAPLHEIDDSYNMFCGMHMPNEV